MGLAADDFGLTVSTGPDQAAVIPWDAAGPILDSVSDGRVSVIGHDLKPLARALLDRDHDLARPAMDTALAAYIINPSARTYALEELAERLLGLEVVSPDDDTTEQGCSRSRASLI